MNVPATIDEELRAHLIAQPETILDDQDVMRALIAANERTMGGNIVDMRGIAMERLEARLDRLEDTHRSVIAAAYDNISGMNMIHRAVLRMLDPADFELFMADLGGKVAEILRVDCVRLVLETEQGKKNNAVERLGSVLSIAEPGFVDDYLGMSSNQDTRRVFLRQIQEQDETVYGDTAFWVRSEACVRLDLGEGRLPGMLVLGVEDANQFKPGQGTDLLGFFGGVFERAMRRWLS